QVPPELAGFRLDQALARLFPAYSRSRLAVWIRNGQALVDGKTWRPRDKVRGGEQLSVNALAEAQGEWRAQSLTLDIVYEDAQLLIINKPPGLVVHPGAGNPEGTLLNALLHHAPQLREIPRAGIVHRLDKDTSGLLVVARTLSAQKSLVKQLQAHSVQREYAALVNGEIIAGGRIEAPLGRDRVSRTRMAVTQSGQGKAAITHYRVQERFRAHTLVKVMLETGRTHQIRVHMAHIRHPVLGDPVYGGRLRMPPSCSEELREALRSFKRQALHAAHLALEHPETGAHMEWSAPLPADMTHLIKLLRKDVREHE
ncbi:MAG: 23S rRNA pseudouridine(1911/1915/1917) synthase RluD, partial [Gammaproteobacteria bacterium]|nr:23S rRNA pseudouridine(1911/1915/1917) synthase RluD [Gammaproteobacteria bacterium]